jgi:hypothetical protein
MTTAMCGVVYPPTHRDDGVSHRCGLFEGHEGDHRDWGVLESPGEVTSWTFTWSTEVMGN